MEDRTLILSVYRSSGAPVLRLNLLLRVTGALCGRSLPAYSKSVGAWLVGLVRPWARVCKSSFYRPKSSMLASTQWSRSVHCLSKICTLFNWWPHEKEERRQDYLPNRRDSTCSHTFSLPRYFQSTVVISSFCRVYSMIH